MFDALYAIAFRYARFAVWAGGAMMIFSALMVSTDVLARRVFGVTMGGSDEISGYLFAVATALAFPYALLHRANVRIDALSSFFPPRVRAALDIFGVTMLSVFAGAVTWHAALSVMVTWENGSRSITPLQTPLIVPQAFWLTGWILFCICLGLVLFGMILATLRGDLAKANMLGGTLSMDEEISGEAASLNINSVTER